MELDPQSYQQPLTLYLTQQRGVMVHSHTRCAALRWDGMGCALRCDAVFCSCT